MEGNEGLTSLCTAHVAPLSSSLKEGVNSSIVQTLKPSFYQRWFQGGSVFTCSGQTLLRLSILIGMRLYVPHNSCPQLIKSWKEKAVKPPDSCRCRLRWGSRLLRRSRVMTPPTLLCFRSVTRGLDLSVGRSGAEVCVLNVAGMLSTFWNRAPQIVRNTSIAGNLTACKYFVSLYSHFNITTKHV